MKKYNSIYDWICGHLDGQGKLEYSFSDYEEEDDSMVFVDSIFAPGAGDGISLYHTMYEMRTDTEAYTTLVAMLDAAAAGEMETASARMEEFLEMVEPIYCVQQVEDCLKDYREAAAAANILAFARQRATGAVTAEAVKLALEIMAGYDTDQDEALKTIVRRLAYLEDLAFYAGRVMKTWTDGNREIFEAAKCVKEWGRVHLIHMLEDVTPEMQDWLLLQGTDEDTLGMYTCIDCYDLIDFMGILQDEHLDHTHYYALATMLAELVNNGPTHVIYSLGNEEQRRKIITEFIRVTKARPDLDEEDYRILRHFLGGLRDNDFLHPKEPRYDYMEDSILTRDYPELEGYMEIDDEEWDDYADEAEIDEKAGEKMPLQEDKGSGEEQAESNATGDEEQDEDSTDVDEEADGSVEREIKEPSAWQQFVADTRVAFEDFLAEQLGPQHPDAISGHDAILIRAQARREMKEREKENPKMTGYEYLDQYHQIEAELRERLRNGEKITPGE